MSSDDNFSHDTSAQDLNSRRAPNSSRDDCTFPLQQLVGPENARQTGEWSYPAVQYQTSSFGTGVADPTGRYSLGMAHYGQRYPTVQEDRPSRQHQPQQYAQQQIYSQQQESHAHVQQHFGQGRPVPTYTAPSCTAPILNPQTSLPYSMYANTASAPAAQTPIYYQSPSSHGTHSLSHQRSVDSPRPLSQVQQKTNVEQGFQQNSHVDQSYQYASHVHPSESAFSQQQPTIFPQSSTRQAQSARFTAQLALVEHDRREQLKLIQQQQLQKGQHSQEETEQHLRREHHQRNQQIQRDQLAQRDLQIQREQQAQREKDQQWAVEKARCLASIVQRPTSLPPLPNPRASSPAQIQVKPPTPVMRSETLTAPPEAKNPQAHLYLPKPATPQATSSTPQATSRTAGSVTGTSNAPQPTQTPQAPRARPDSHDPKAPRPIQTHPASQALQAHPVQPVAGLTVGKEPDYLIAELQKSDTTRFNAYMSEFVRKQQPPTQVPQAPQALQLPVHVPIAQPAAIPSRTETAQPAPQQQQKGLQKAPQPQQAPRKPQTPLWSRNSTPQPLILGQVLQAQLGAPAPPPKQLLSVEDAGVLAAAVVSYLQLQGVTVSIGKVRDLLQSAADFDIMCAYIDTLGHSCDRPKLAKHMISALEQAKKERQQPSVPPSMKVPNPQPLGKADHPQRQPTPTAMYQQAPYGTLPGHSPVTQTDQTGGSICLGDSLGAVRGRGRFQGNSTVAVTPAGQPKRDLPTRLPKREGLAAHPPPPPLPPPVAAVPTPPKDIVVIADSPSPPATPRRLDIDSHSPNKNGGRMHNNGAAPPGPITMSLSQAPIPANRDAPSVETPRVGQTGWMQGPQFAQPLVETISRKKAVRVSQYDPATIARDILIIAGKHPTERGLNDHLLPLKDNMGLVWNSDLSTVRWDLIDPSPILLDDGDGDDEMDGGEGVALLTLAVSKKRARIHVHRSAPGGQATGIAATPNSNGNKNAVPAPHTTPSHRVSARREANLATQPIIIDSRPPSPTTPMGSEKPPKRRRTDAANAFTPSNAPKKFLVFHCKWEECDAELHNLELLKRHLMTIHKTESPHDNRFTCKWLQCARPPTRKQKSMEGGQKSMRYDFASEEEWQAHVDGHTEAVRQTLGWGPAVSQSDHELPLDQVDYLSDHTGKQITPVASAAKPLHTFVPPPGFPMTKTFKDAHGIKTPCPGMSWAAEKRLLESFSKLGSGMSKDETGVLGDVVVVQGSSGPPFIKTVKGDWPKKT